MSAISWIELHRLSVGRDHRSGLQRGCQLTRLDLGAPAIHSLEQVIAYPQRVGHDRERRIHRAARAEEAGIDNVEIVELVRFAVAIERARSWIVAESGRCRSGARRPASGMRWPR